MMSQGICENRDNRSDDEKVLEHRAYGEGGREDDEDDDVSIELDGTGGQIDDTQDKPNDP